MQPEVQREQSGGTAPREGVPSVMRAVVVRRYGGPEVLEHVEAQPVPVPAPGEVLVRVRATGMNPADVNVRSGQLWMITGRQGPKRPVLGYDIAGEVARTGEGWEEGTRVFAMLDLGQAGGAAQYVTVPARLLARIPPGLSFEEAAAVPLAALTAHQALVDVARLRSGQRVLVRGASGGVGGYAVQLASALGAHVTAVASAHNAEWLRGLGAHAVVDYANTPLSALAGPFDMFFDVRGGTPHRAVRPLLTPRGIHVTVMPSFGGFLLAPLLGMLPGPRFAQHLAKPNGAQLAELAAKLESGALRSTLTRTLPFTDIAEAHRALATGHTRGKLVLRWA